MKRTGLSNPRKRLLLSLLSLGFFAGMSGCAFHVGTNYAAGSNHIDNVYANVDAGR